MKKQINEIRRMQQLAGISNQLNEDKKEIWKGERELIPIELRNEILKYSNKEEEINKKLGNKRLNGKGSDIFDKIDFEAEEIFYIASAGPSEYDGEQFFDVESFDFGEGDIAYKGEIKILKQLIEKIKEKGIQPNNK